MATISVVVRAMCVEYYFLQNGKSCYIIYVKVMWAFLTLLNVGDSFVDEGRRTSRSIVCHSLWLHNVL